MKILLPILIGQAVMILSAEGVVLAQYDFEATGGALANKVSNAGVTVSAVGFGTKFDSGDGFSTNTTTTGGAQSLTVSGGGLGVAAVSTSAAFTEAATDGNYITFTITPEVGQTINLTSLTFDKGRLTGNTNTLRILVTSSLTDTFEGRLALTNSSSSLPNVLESEQAGEISAITTGAGQSWGTNPNVSVNLSGAAFQNITAPVSFRIYAFSLGSDSGNAANQLFFDNITLNGAVVPEPSTAALGVVGLVALMRRRR